MTDNDLENVECFGCGGNVPVVEAILKPEPEENNVNKERSIPFCSDECYTEVFLGKTNDR